MPAVILNAGLILLGSLMGVLFRNHIGARLNTILSHALGLCVLSIGFSSAIDTENTLCVIVCMVAGTILGELLRIEEHLDAAGGLLRKKLVRGGDAGRFTEGFVTASVLFCVGFLLFPGWKLGFAGYMGAFIGLNLVLCGVLYLWLKKRGCGVFAAL